jgi:heptosyltransferase-2
MEKAATTNHPPSSILHPRRILVRGVNWLGDAVMSTPALLRLRERFPEAHIALLTPEKLRDLWLHHPAIDQIVPFDAGAAVWRVAWKIKASTRATGKRQGGLKGVGQGIREGDWSEVEESARELLSLADQMHHPFDLALVLPNSPRSALEVWLARIPHRIGYARPWRNWLLTQTIPARSGHVRMRKRSANEVRKLVADSIPHPATRNTQHASHITYPISTHHIYDYLHVAAALGANPDPLPPQLHVTTSEVGTAAHKFGLHFAGREEHPLFGLNAGAEYGPAKRWPRERFVSAAAELQRRTHCQWVIFGGKAETDLASSIAQEIERLQKEFTHHAAQFAPPVNVAGLTSLRELCALLKLCRVLLTNDTGPMHVAAALGTPVVVPFGSTSPELTGPGLPGDGAHRLLKSDAPCAPCFRRTCPIDFRCMTGIPVERVVEAVLQTAHAGSYS